MTINLHQNIFYRLYCLVFQIARWNVQNQDCFHQFFEKLNNLLICQFFLLYLFLVLINTYQFVYIQNLSFYY